MHSTIGLAGDAVSGYLFIKDARSGDYQAAGEDLVNGGLGIGLASGVPPIQIACGIATVGIFAYEHSHTIQQIWKDVGGQAVSNAVQDGASYAAEGISEGSSWAASQAEHGWKDVTGWLP